MSLYRRCRCAHQDDEEECAHVWWYKFKYRGEPVRGSTYQTNRRKAEQVEIKRHGEVIDHGTGILRRQAPRLAAHLADYLEWARNDHPASTDMIDARILPTLLDVVGNKPIDKVSPFDIERWRNARVKTPIRGGRTLGRSSVNRELIVVRGCFSKAVEWKRLTESPVDGIEPWETDDTAIRVLTAEERVIVLTQLPPLHAMLCRVTLEALLRLSEVLGLRREDLGPASLQRRLKGGKVQTIPVTSGLIADLRLWLKTPHQVHVFGDPPPDSHATSAAMTEAFRAVGLPHIHHHIMRHTGVTDMLEDGVNPRAIQEYAGWTTLRMLGRYGHLRDAELLKATAGTAARNNAAFADAARQAAAQGDTAAPQVQAPAKKGAQKGAHGAG